MVRKVLLSLAWLGLALAQTSPSSAKEGDAAFSVSPDSAYINLTAALMEARASIDMNVYMFTSKNIANVLATKAAEGIKIRVLVEGEPHGGTVFPAVKETLEGLNQAFRASPGKNASLLVMTGKGDAAKRRYVFDHAKYVVIDNKKVFVSSDNFTGSAFPDPSRTVFAGGTRGWQVYLENSQIASELSEIFAGDVSGKKDVVAYEKSGMRVSDPGKGKPLPDRQKRTAESFGIELGRSGKASICASPKSEECVLDFIRSAKKELLVEHLSLPMYWALPGVSTRDNPIVTELVSAARRGVKVKLLVNDDKIFSDPDEDKNQDEKLSNNYLVTELTQKARREKLPLEAALFSAANTQTSYVHNKGIVADGSRVFVSSINGTMNSVERNREIAISLESKDGARYFGEVFQFDWENRQQ